MIIRSILIYRGKLIIFKHGIEVALTIRASNIYVKTINFWEIKTKHDQRPKVDYVPTSKHEQRPKEFLA